jgi:hypothetical protein
MTRLETVALIFFSVSMCALTATILHTRDHMYYMNPDVIKCADVKALIHSRGILAEQFPDEAGMYVQEDLIKDYEETCSHMTGKMESLQ